MIQAYHANANVETFKFICEIQKNILLNHTTSMHIHHSSYSMSVPNAGLRNVSSSTLSFYYTKCSFSFFFFFFVVNFIRSYGALTRWIIVAMDLFFFVCASQHAHGQVFKTLQSLVESLDSEKISMGAIVTENETRELRHLRYCASERKIPMMVGTLLFYLFPPFWFLILLINRIPRPLGNYQRLPGCPKPIFPALEYAQMLWFSPQLSVFSWSW